ncbi:hypothetical protein GUITHDRAFT_110462 [Guillardia theta CCMP2712]|uniref:Uncharacterized protein n=2 Tax=Guillardia theta TaxID=55529 RepID=L1J6C8_GUITC|nr:hypothetical protein GUITHDRAFT_110462 [Guillardia theta CCMP2712]EKX43664.1 hypothetical protein GUITHDRAFT_110462 [Guillardia theta CCMP2712]|mmetsp:Transcript_13/g.32  ORF Transcript_13/g.32 Transcript_13/m.32 type:complete len:200 (+) Transcript_13:136-735(+)|eukprot:XP_005830644.1 hypothetical protein GUITHDRAFT_110462 [Guillardia theta CCMP2712]
MRQHRKGLAEQLKDPGDKSPGEGRGAVEKMMTLHSEPAMSLPKKQFYRLGGANRTAMSRKKMSLNHEREGAMSQSDPLYKPRFAARHEHAKSATSTSWPQIEVMKVEGDVVGIPGNTSLQRYSSMVEDGKRKQIIIAIHENKSASKPSLQSRGSVDSETALIRSGMNIVSKQLAEIRESLAESRRAHNTFNDVSKFSYE